MRAGALAWQYRQVGKLVGGELGTAVGDLEDRPPALGVQANLDPAAGTLYLTAFSIRFPASWASSSGSPSTTTARRSSRTVSLHAAGPASDPFSCHPVERNQVAISHGDLCTGEAQQPLAPQPDDRRSRGKQAVR